MANLFQDISKAVSRTVKAEGSDIPSGKFVIPGTSEEKAILSSAADDLISGFTVEAAKENNYQTIIESNAYVEVTASEPVANNVRVYLSSDGQRLTDIKPVASGYYISPGISRSSASAANKKFVLFLDFQEFTV